MADTRPSTLLPSGVWVDLYAATNDHPQGAIPVGTKLNVKNESMVPVRLASSELEPIDSDKYRTMRGYEVWINDSGDSGAWAMARGADSIVNIQEG